MNDYEIGTALRERLKRDQQQGGTVDGRRLQALVGDLCGDDPRLLPAMRYLVSWQPFLREMARRPPLADARLALRVRQELREIFAMPVCERMDAVMNGLLDLPENAPAPPPRWGTTPRRGAAPQPAAVEGRGSFVSAVGLCLVAFVGGGLLALLVGLLLPAAQEPIEPQLGPAMPEASRRPGSAVSLQVPRAA